MSRQLLNLFLATKLQQLIAYLSNMKMEINLHIFWFTYKTKKCVLKLSLSCLSSTEPEERIIYLCRMIFFFSENTWLLIFSLSHLFSQLSWDVWKSEREWSWNAGCFLTWVKMFWYLNSRSWCLVSSRCILKLIHSEGQLFSGPKCYTNSF